MSGPPSELDPIGKLAEAFLARYRRGERPSLAEYAEGHPELAEQIRELFPALVLMEELGEGEGSRLPSPLPFPSGRGGNLFTRLILQKPKVQSHVEIFRPKDCWSYMWEMMLSLNWLHLISVAPSIWRAKS